MTFEVDQTGQCPHCNVQVRFEAVGICWERGQRGTPTAFSLKSRTGFQLSFTAVGCPGCHRVVLFAKDYFHPEQPLVTVNTLMWPDSGARFVPIEVEEQSPDLAADFREAASVFPKSKKASAALSRRCLQFVLKDKGGVSSGNLSRQIEEVIDSLPSELGANVDAIRHVGNFAAHPIKADASGQIVAVEEGEAEWLLDVLEELFDYYYVAPAKAEERRAALNAKLEAMGKPVLKSPSAES